MNVESAEVALAYTYAWWLTGDALAARAAVLAAVDRPDVPGADDGLRMEILLRRVRSAAIAEPTMCPASELALLHDAIGLGLDAAAGLALVDARDARTELAHGRLEALDAGAEFTITAPERLGGLAVGNPADVAAARQNPQLAALHKAIFDGRDELVTVAKVEVPEDLLELAADRQRTPDTGVPIVVQDDDWFGEVDRAADRVEATSLAEEGTPAPDRVTSAGLMRATPRRSAYTELPPAASATGQEEIDLSGHMPETGRSDGGHPSSQRRASVVWLLVGLVVLVGVVVLLNSNGGDVLPDPGTDVTTSAPAATPTPAADEASAPPATATPIATSDPFTAGQAGVAVGIGSDPDFDNPTAGPLDPMSVTVDYGGAEEGDALLVVWSVDGTPFDSERFDLSPVLESARFSKQVPEAGWPVGQHILTLTLERTGEVVGEARFQVVPAEE